MLHAKKRRLLMQIGILGKPDSWYVRELCRTGTQRGHVMQTLVFEQFRASVSGTRLSLHCGSVDVRSLDYVLVRTMSPGTLEQVVARMDVLGGLAACGVGVVNSPRGLECAVDKYLTTQRLALAGLSVPSTVVCENADAALAAFDVLGGDVVVKPLFGSEGRGIMRVCDRELARRAFRTLERLGAVLYVQQFIAGPGFDIRILLLDGQLIGAMQRFPREGDFRANISQQGTAIRHTPTAAELRLASAAAIATECDFAGVDLMYAADGNPLLIEVNAVPGWKGLARVCGVDVPDRLFHWLERRA